MFIVKYRKIWFTLSALLIGASFWAMFNFGFNLSIDFRGGTLTEIHYADGRPAKSDIERWVGVNDFGSFSVRETGETGYVIRTRELSETEKQGLQSSLAASSRLGEVERQTTIGPTAGAELQSKAVKAIVLVLLMIVLFVTYAFRGVSSGASHQSSVSSWKYGLATVIALAHDIIIPTGLFVFFGQYFGYEIDLLFITGLLAILGYSVHDTIVVFDRVRENLRVNAEQHIKEDFEVVVGKSLTQTMARSINTSGTLLITIVALYFFGPISTTAFSLLLIVGLVAGTYSSIFVASPLLVTLYKLQNK